MKTILFSQIQRKKVGSAAEEGSPKVVDLIGTRSNSYIKVKELEVETGLINREVEFFPIEAVKPFKSKDKVIYLKDFKSGHKHSTADISLSSLKNSRVYDSREEQIGRIYDYEIYIKEMPWIVWKMLIKSHLISVIERRLRVPIKHISSIEGDKIHLDKEIKIE